MKGEPTLRPKPRLRDSLKELSVIDFLLAVCSASGLFVTAYRFGKDGDSIAQLISILLGIIVLLISFWKACIAWQSKHDLLWLYPFLQGLSDTLQSLGEPGEKLRICIHVSHGDLYWRQITEYVGENCVSGKINRIFPRRRGIIGLAARQPDTSIVGSIPKNMSREEYFVKAFSFERQEVASVKSSCNAWAAICVGEPSGFQAVIYCDCETLGYFGGKKTNPRRKALNAAGVSLARYLSSR